MAILSSIPKNVELGQGDPRRPLFHPRSEAVGKAFSLVALLAALFFLAFLYYHLSWFRRHPTKLMRVFDILAGLFLIPVFLLSAVVHSCLNFNSFRLRGHLAYFGYAAIPFAFALPFHYLITPLFAHVLPLALIAFVGELAVPVFGAYFVVSFTWALIQDKFNNTNRKENNHVPTFPRR